MELLDLIFSDTQVFCKVVITFTLSSAMYECSSCHIPQHCAHLKFLPIWWMWNVIGLWFKYAFPWLLKMLRNFFRHKTKCYTYTLFIFLKFTYLFWERECTGGERTERERERERMPSRLCTQCKAQRRAWTHECEIRTWAVVWHLDNWVI